MKKNIQANALGTSSSPKRKRRMTRKRKRLYILCTVIIIVLVINVFNLARKKLEEIRKEEAMSNFGNINSSEEEGSIEPLEITEDLPLNISIIDAGLGDSCLLQSGDLDILIDSGSKEKAAEIIEYLKSNVSDGNIEYLINTNPSFGKASNIKEIVDAFNVKNLILAECKNKSADEYQLNKDNMRLGRDRRILIRTQKENLSLGQGISVSLNPIEMANGDINIITTVIHNEISLFFPGDATNENLTNIISELKDVNLMVYPNNGKELLSDEVYSVLNPYYLVLSSSSPETNGNKYPSSDVLKMYGNSSNTIITYRDGTTAISDEGGYLNLKTENDNEEVEYGEIEIVDNDETNEPLVTEEESVEEEANIVDEEENYLENIDSN